MENNLYFLYFLTFMLGASFASFIAVYVERLKGDNFFNLRTSLKKRSMCTECKKELTTFELIPIFSYLFLRGKCKKCKTKIPIKLFVGEIFLGAWFLASFFYFLHQPGGKIYFALSLIFGCFFYLISLEDLEDMQVSSRFIYTLVNLGILNALFKFYFNGNFYELFVPMLVISPFWIIYFFNKNAIGEADPYVYSALALFYGIQFSISLFLYSVWFGAAYGIFYLKFINKKFERGVRIPYLPIIFVSALFILIFNFHIIKIQDILLLNDFFFSNHL